MSDKLIRAFAAIPLLSSLAMVGVVSPALGDDTEIYKSTFSSANGTNPKVLIVFDDSGSMGNNTNTKPRFDPDDADEYANAVPDGRIYWSTNGNVPDADSNQWFDASKNRCASSSNRLDNKGFFLASNALRWYDPSDVEGECTFSCDSGTFFAEDPTDGGQDNACWTTSANIEPGDVWEWAASSSSFFGIRYCANSSHTLIKIGNSYGCYSSVESADGITGWLEREDDENGSCNNPDYTLLAFPTWSGTSYGCYEEVTGVAGVAAGTNYDFVENATEFCPDDSTNTTGEWIPLSGDVNEPTHVECRDDVDDDEDDNLTWSTDGFPQNDVDEGDEYAGSIDETVPWNSTPYFFYTSDYMNWHHDEGIPDESRDKIDVAQEVIEDIVYTTPSVDFGLLEFNNSAGGRITQRLIENMDETDITSGGVTRTARENLIYLINSLRAGGSTPMCESMWEAYLYLAGAKPEYYDNRSTGNSNHDPQDYDPEAMTGSGSGLRYIPPNTDCAYTYIILMTDGLPNSDGGANNWIKNLSGVVPTGTGGNCKIYADDAGGDHQGEYCQPELAWYMANTDLDGNDDNGNQFGITYTIGFQTDQDLLEDTANAGGGAYYTADDAAGLRSAFRGALVSILAEETTFTSPAVAVDTFTRTQSRNEIFYAMFEPQDSVNWPGNIKKLQLTVVDDKQVLLDKNGQPALETDSGEFKTTAITFWSTEADGGVVKKGGVGALLAARDPGTRNLYINTGTSEALEAFNTTNITYDAMGVADDNALYRLFGTGTQAAFEQQIAWAQGYDAYNEDGDASTSDPLTWVMGDILHSQPLVLNYGARSGFDPNDPDLRILSGTNQGWVHMFGSNDGQEDWAFFPKELANIIPLRRRDADTSDNIYGMDLTPVAFTYDGNSDGTIDSGAGDKAWVFLGMRRGGRAYYALDVSNPDTPSFMWRISNTTAGFSELGQTWSQPVVTYIPGYRDSDTGVLKPVLIFGAGYDVNKDPVGLGTPDTRGRGIFIVDAASGSLVWSVTPGSNSATNLSEPELDHSVPADVSVLDSNGDSMTDRIYFGDTGGNLWRVDLVGNSLPTSSQDTWKITKMGEFNGGSSLTDRRFFNAPDIVRIRFDGQAVDAVIIGTGDRTNPNATDVDNRVYMIRDEATAPYSTAYPNASDCDEDGFVDFRCDLPLTDADLYDITTNTINDGADEAERSVALDALKAANGWRLDLVHAGEKNLAKTLTINGKAYIPTFTPSVLFDAENMCTPEAGTGLLHIVDIYDGDRSSISLGSLLPDTPSLHFSEDGKISFLLPPGTPADSIEDPGDLDCSGGVCDVFENLRPPYGNYWFQEEY